MPKYTLNWKGDACREQVVAAIVSGLNEFGLRHETASKGQLSPGHGVLTGTLRRSIHAAAPGYAWAGDDVNPSSSSPERGGQAGATEEAGRVVVAVGSGMSYARIIEERYGYVEQGHNAVKGQLLGIIAAHAAAMGLT